MFKDYWRVSRNIKTMHFETSEKAAANNLTKTTTLHVNMFSDITVQVGNPHTKLGVLFSTR